MNMTMALDKLKRDFEKVENRYNGDFDIIPGAPTVTWADRQLLDMIEQLGKMIECQQEQIAKLEKQIAEIPERTLEMFARKH